MSDESNGNSPRWGRAIRREASDDPARSQYVDQVVLAYRRKQVEAERLEFEAWRQQVRVVVRR